MTQPTPESMSKLLVEAATCPGDDCDETCVVCKLYHQHTLNAHRVDSARYRENVRARKAGKEVSPRKKRGRNILPDFMLNCKRRIREQAKRTANTARYRKQKSHNKPHLVRATKVHKDTVSEENIFDSLEDLVEYYSQ